MPPERRKIRQMTVRITICNKDSFCKDCKDEECLHAGEIIADCPKWKCDQSTSCKTCNFIQDYYNSFKRGEK